MSSVSMPFFSRISSWVRFITLMVRSMACSVSKVPATNTPDFSNRKNRVCFNIHFTRAGIFTSWATTIFLHFMDSGLLQIKMVCSLIVIHLFPKCHWTCCCSSHANASITSEICSVTRQRALNAYPPVSQDNTVSARLEFQFHSPLVTSVVNGWCFPDVLAKQELRTAHPSVD